MGRKRTVNNNLPPRMTVVTKPNGTAYYYYDTGGKPRYKSLGSNYVEAMRLWAELEQEPVSNLLYFKDVADRYRLEIIPSKAARTKKDNQFQLDKLIEFFGDGKFEEIKPLHIRQYREWRQKSPIAANREIALFSHIWNCAREWGVTDKANPCAGVKRNKEAGRNVYISDEEYAAIMKVAPPLLSDTMELAYLTGQRPTDVLKLRETNIKDGCIELRQGKTDLPLRIIISPAIQAVLDKCKSRKSGKVYNTSIIVGPMGKPVGRNWISTLWKTARLAAGITRDIQFRDLRAKAVSDKEESSDIRSAQALAGHSTVSMTEHYSRKRRGQKVEPTR